MQNNNKYMINNNIHYTIINHTYIGDYSTTFAIRILFYSYDKDPIELPFKKMVIGKKYILLENKVSIQKIHYDICKSSKIQNTSLIVWHVQTPGFKHCE